MIYEACIVLRQETPDEKIQKVKEMVQKEVESTAEGEILINDDWGLRVMAQPTSRGLEKGRYLYFMYSSDGTKNAEIERKFRINEDKIKFLFTKIGKPQEKEALKKSYVSPFATDDSDDWDRYGRDKEKRMFSKRRSCWFSANKTKADWKVPSTYSWLVNEFGKINPARVSGITSKNQTLANKAIKQARNIGLISHVSNRLAY